MWIYTPLEDAMSEAGLQEVETYVSRCQNTIRKVHCNQAHYGYVSGGGVDTGPNDILAVVGTGWSGYGRDADCILGGGTG